MQVDQPDAAVAEEVADAAAIAGLAEEVDQQAAEAGDPLDAGAAAGVSHPQAAAPLRERPPARALTAEEKAVFKKVEFKRGRSDSSRWMWDYLFRAANKCVWKNKAVEQHKLFCTLCNAVVGVKYDGRQTTGALSHMKDVHKLDSTGRRTSDERKPKSVAITEAERAELNAFITLALLRDGRPLASAHGYGMHQILAKMRVGFVPGTRQALRKHALALSEKSMANKAAYLTKQMWLAITIGERSPRVPLD
jgi:hypothetical protein